MKRFIVLFLSLVMILGLSSCGSNDINIIRDALQGSWEANWTYEGTALSRYYTFTGNKFTTGGVAFLGKVNPRTGTYEIKNSCIHCVPDDGSGSNDLDYKYNKKTGTLTLWWDKDVQFTKKHAKETQEDNTLSPSVEQKKEGTYSLQSCKIYWWDNKEQLKGPSITRNESSIKVDDTNLSEGTTVDLTYCGTNYKGTVNKNGHINWGKAPNIIEGGSEFGTKISKSGNTIEIVIEYLLLEEKVAVGVTLLYD